MTILSFLFIILQSFGVGQPRRIENAKILIANTPMDTDKIKIYGSRVSKNCGFVCGIALI